MRSEGRGQGQRNKFCLAVALSVMALCILKTPSVLFSEKINTSIISPFGTHARQQLFSPLTPVKMQSSGVHEVYVVTMNAQLHHHAKKRIYPHYLTYQPPDTFS